MNWDEFTYWAGRFAESVDIDAKERAWRLECARLLGEARTRLLAGSPAWVDAFVRGIRKSDLHFIFVDNLRKAGLAKSDELGAAVLTVWDADPDPARLDDLEDALAAVLGRVTPGNATALGSHLLLAMDPGSFPTYGAEFVTEWSRRVGMPDLGSARPSERYRRLLDLCDATLDACGRAGIPLRDRLDARGLGYWVLKGPAPTEWTDGDAVRLAALRGVPTLGAAERGSGRSPEMEAAAWVVLGAGLQGEPSPFDPGVVSWKPENAVEAIERIYSERDPGAGSYLERLRSQLAGAPRGVILLVAELLYLHALPLTNVSAQTKRKRIETVLGWLPDPPPIPEGLAAGFNAPGSFHGTGFSIQIWAQLVWLLRFVERWTTLPDGERFAARTDPEDFAGMLRQVVPDAPSIRHGLKYLAWPGRFDSLVNTAHRLAIRNAFAYRIGGPSGDDETAIDRDLYAIRQVLDAEAGHRVDFYLSPYLEQWWKEAPPEGVRAWLVRPKPQGSATVARWTGEDFVSLVAQYLGEVPAGADLAEVRTAVEKGYLHLDYAQRLALAGEYYAFLNRMKPDDLVATVVEDRLHVGVVAGDPEYSTDPDARLRRAMHWTKRAVRLNELAPPLPGLLDQQGTVVDLTSALGEVQRLAGPDLVGEEDAGEGREPPSTPKPAVPVLRAATDEFAGSVHLPRPWLQEMIDLLQSRQQIVFYGPPGTGKSHVARELARHLVGADDPSRSRLVQFHPSYAYEDFFEGFRPAEGGSFVLTPGPLRDLAAAALAAPGEPFVLIIDEMNRANLAKVFGELYFLLEYRDQAIRLQYRPTEAFRLPPNLFLIGTMNTADRSIALVDAAIRRRFAFVELHPDVEPVRDLLGNFLTANKRPADPMVRLLRALNAQIEDADRDLRIGPTYLMRSDVSKPGGLERAWRYDLLPLLEEHYYGRYTREEIHRRFGLEALLGVVGSAGAAEVFDDSAGSVAQPDAGEPGTGAGEA